MTNDLAERVEQATGPDRELDYAISEAVGRGLVRSHRPLREDFAEEHGGFTIPRYTASLDAAMTLVPEGCLWTMDSWHDQGWSAGVWRVRGAGSWLVNSNKDRQSRTPALALCSAALRARQQGDGE